MNKKSRIILFMGFLATIGYVAIFYFSVTPMDNLITFLKTAPFNERGDFLAGLFGPLTFLWLLIGYLFQAESISVNREQIYAQCDLILHQLEMQNRTYDPIFTLHLDKNRVCHISNVGNEVARQVMLLYIDHKAESKSIIAMANALGGNAVMEVELQPPLRLPVKIDEELPYELLIVYNSRVDDLRGQRFHLIEASGSLIGWQIETANKLPAYFNKYKRNITKHCT